jgi:hypothetical protein
MKKTALAGSAMALILGAGLTALTTSVQAQVYYDQTPRGYVMIPGWAAPAYRGRSAHRYNPDDSYAARGTVYDPYHPDPGVVTDAH